MKDECHSGNKEETGTGKGPGGREKELQAGLQTGTSVSSTGKWEPQLLCRGARRYKCESVHKTSQDTQGFFF
jgi:hypothetical protein